METLLAHIRQTTGKPTHSACGHEIAGMCGGCHAVTYCGMNCQASHWQAQHKYECIGVKRGREEEEPEALIDLSQLRDLWGIIQPWLSAEDLKNLRLASPDVEQQIRRTYFARFRVRLSPDSFAGLRQGIARFITKVDDSESGGRLALELSRAQRNKALKDVRIYRAAQIDWDSLTQLVNLTVLDLSFNKLRELPESFGNLVNLTILDLGSDKLTELPESFGNLVNLTTLDLSWNELTEVPESFHRLVNLTKLYLRRNKLTELPESFGKLVNLTILDLNTNRLTELPESFRDLVKLTLLRLSNNLLTKLPASFGDLVNLTTLSLSNNQLTVLPESFHRLVNLTKLDLRWNQLTELPESFSKLVNLRKLWLDSNQLTNQEKARLRALFGDKVFL